MRRSRPKVFPWTRVTTTQGPLSGGTCSKCPLCGPAGECFDYTIKSGRCGDWVFYLRNGRQCRRRFTKPFDPKTRPQLDCRTRFAAASRSYSDVLTQAQQDACIAAGAKIQTRPRLGQSGPMTGLQYWMRQVMTGKATLPGLPPLASKSRSPARSPKPPTTGTVTAHSPEAAPSLPRSPPTDWTI